MTDDNAQDYRGRHVASPFRGLKLGLAALALSLILPAALFKLYTITTANTDGETDIGWLVGWILFGYVAIPAALTFGVLAIRKNRALGKIIGALAIVIGLVVIGWHLLGVLVNEGYVTL